MMTRRAFALLSILVLVAGCGARDTMAPGAWKSYIAPGSQDRFQVRVRLAEDPPSLEQVDILFLFDITGSMRHVISEVRDNAGTIMQAIRHSNPNSAFAVASFADYGVGVAWRLNRDVTSDPGEIAAAIASLTLYDGQDIPEAYSRALYEARFIGWRPGARRFVILFGDAPAHDPDFFGENTGIDPGRDGVPNTPDDLRFNQVVAGLKQDGIVVLANYVPGDALARRGFEYVAAQTGGVAIPVRDAKQVPAAILTGLSEQSFTRPELSADPEFAAWIAISPGRRLKSGDLREFVYDVEVSVPPAARKGVHRFALNARYQDPSRSVHIGATQVTVLTDLLYHPVWRWLLLLAALLLLLLWWRRQALEGTSRFLHNWHFSRGLLRLLGLAVFAFGVYLVWRYLAGEESVLPQWTAWILNPKS